MLVDIRFIFTLEGNKFNLKTNTPHHLEAFISVNKDGRGSDCMHFLLLLRVVRQRSSANAGVSRYMLTPAKTIIPPLARLRVGMYIPLLCGAVVHDVWIPGIICAQSQKQI